MRGYLKQGGMAGTRCGRRGVQGNLIKD